MDRFAELDKLRPPQPPQPSGDYEPDDLTGATYAEFLRRLEAL
jgi:hypothetical protein